MRDVSSVFLGGLLAMIVYHWLIKEYYSDYAVDPYAQYVPDIEGFERMNLQAPDVTDYKPGTLERVQ